MEHAKTRWYCSEGKQKTARFSAFLQHPKNLLPRVNEIHIFWSRFCYFDTTDMFRIFQSGLNTRRIFG
jgi:hypothetical protein